MTSQYTRLETLRAAARSMRAHHHSAHAVTAVELVIDKTSELLYHAQDPGYSEQFLFQGEPFSSTLQTAEAWLQDHPVT